MTLSDQHYCDALYRAETAEARVARLEAEVARLRFALQSIGIQQSIRRVWQIAREALGLEAPPHA